MVKLAITGTELGNHWPRGLDSRTNGGVRSAAYTLRKSNLGHQRLDEFNIFATTELVQKRAFD
jgi:hypothetical protein